MDVQIPPVGQLSQKLLVDQILSWERWASLLINLRKNMEKKQKVQWLTDRGSGLLSAPTEDGSGLLRKRDCRHTGGKP